MARWGEGSHLSALAPGRPHGDLPPPGGHEPHTVTNSNVPARSRGFRDAQGAVESPHRVRGQRAWPAPLQRGPRRWRPVRVQVPARALSSRARAGSSEEPPVPGAEDWDFVGQLNRHPHLARKDPALNSRPSCCSEFGVRARPRPSPSGWGRPRRPHAIQHTLSAEAPGFLRAASPEEGTRPAQPRPPDSETSPGRVTRRSSACGSFQAPPPPPAQDKGSG